MVVAALLASCVVLGLPTAAVARGPDPSLSEMALQTTDLPAGSRLEHQGFSKNSGLVASYARTFTLPGVRIGKSTPLVLENDIGLAEDAETAGFFALGAAFLLADKSDRNDLARGLVGGSKRSVPARAIRADPLRVLDIGDGVIADRLYIRTHGRVVQATIAFVTVNRVFASLIVVSAPGKRSRVADAVPLLRTLAHRIRAGLRPHNTAAPAIAGSALVGETLTAGDGIWDPATKPKSFAYQWLRCASADSICTPLPGATGEAYNVANADRGSVLRVQVTATNEVGDTAAVSLPTRVV
jgi:hypothetical protein